MRTCAIMFEDARLLNLDTRNGMILALDNDARIRIIRFTDIKSKEDPDTSWTMNEDIDFDDDDDDTVTD